MINKLKRVLLLLVSLLILLMAYSLYISRPQFDEILNPEELGSVNIAPVDVALTFARYNREGQPKLLLVTSVEKGILSGIEISEAMPGFSNELLPMYRTVGYDQLAGLVSDASFLVEVPIEQLQQPMDFTYPYIAVGTNYKDHAEEVYVNDPPFLFPKLAKSSVWNSGINGNSTSHLDYEAEICLVPLEDILEPATNNPMGLVLCNDFTDRWALFTAIKLDEPLGTTGFATAKGKPGYLPVGYLLVIPKDVEFYREINLQLFVNGRMRQNMQTEMMILKPDDIVLQAFLFNELIYHQAETIVPLLPQNKIPAGTLLLSGTGGGVIGQPLNAWNPLLYLKQGDEIITTADHLGHLVNRVE